MQLRRLIIAYFKVPSSRIAQLKNNKKGYLSLKQKKMTMRKFITLDDKMYKDLRKAGGDMSDQTRIEAVEGKINRAAYEAMEKYRDLQITLGQLDATMYADCLKYSNILMQVCSEMDCGSSSGSDSSNEESECDKPAAHKLKKQGVFFSRKSSIQPCSPTTVCAC